MLNMIGVAYYRISLLDSAFNTFQEMSISGERLAISRDEDTANEGKDILGIAYGNMGIVYRIRGDLKTARKYYNKALDLFTQIGAQDKIIWCRDLIAVLDSLEQ